ncbi:hypothetical protein I4U23_000368 [Adineta vaga]|nr:hypothetical protein I4U23_000368 [Adineta vaga]
MTSGGTTKSAAPGAVTPDGGWGWIIVLASFMIHFIMDGITYSMGDIYLQPMMNRLGEGRGKVSTIYGILPAVTLGAGPIVTILVNTYGCRLVTIVGTTMAAGGFLISYFWANVWFYYLAIGVIGGLGFGLIYLPAIVSVGYYFEAKRSFAMGIAVCGSGLGTLAFPLVMPYVINKPLWFDYDGALLLEAGIIFICVIFGGLMVPLPQEPSETRRIEKKTARAEKKRLASQATTRTLSPIDEQRNQLLPKDRESDIALKSISPNERGSSAVVPGEQQFLMDDNERATSPYKDDLTEKIRPEDNTTDVPVVISRKDAVYRGSLHNIPLFNEDVDEYHNQVITTTADVEHEIKAKKSFVTQLTEQIDLNLLKDAAFALFAVSNFLTSLGFNVPYNFANDLAKDKNVPEGERHWIIMTIGIANCFGRVIIGLLGDRKWINRLTLYNTTLIIAGAATIAAPFCTSWVVTHMVYAAFFGFFSGGYVGLTSILVVDLVGVNKLSDAFGTLLLFQGVAVAIGTPICGTMRDIFTGYLWPYLIFGGSILISGVILFAIPFLQRRKESRQQPTKHELDMGVLSYSKQNLSIPDQQQQQQQL